MCSLCGEVHVAVGHSPHKIKTCNVVGSPTNKEHCWERGAVEHVMPLVESSHLYDRLGRAVSHNERLLTHGVVYSSRFPKDDLSCAEIKTYGFWEKTQKVSEDEKSLNFPYDDNVQGALGEAMPSIKHQMRDGQHAWQEATVDDLVPPVYVWHVRDLQDGEVLVDSLKRYYGKLPAVMELFAQAGARVGENYAGLMRENVALPEPDEEKWVV
ncbi:hypothetical protein C3L33_06564, partial [Rhododendron williamsianum]